MSVSQPKMAQYPPLKLLVPDDGLTVETGLTIKVLCGIGISCTLHPITMNIDSIYEKKIIAYFSQKLNNYEYLYLPEPIYIYIYIYINHLSQKYGMIYGCPSVRKKYQNRSQPHCQSYKVLPKCNHGSGGVGA